jgi:hypothetical protein
MKLPGRDGNPVSTAYKAGIYCDVEYIFITKYLRVCMHSSEVSHLEAHLSSREGDSDSYRVSTKKIKSFT